MKRDEYEIMFRVEDRHWWYVGLRAMVALAWKRHAPKGRVRMLDVGCGTGANMRNPPTGADCFGIDFSTDALRFCRERGDAKTAVASANELPFADESFSVALSCDVLCHQSILDKAKPLREIHRVLTPGGVAILNLPAYQWLHSSHDVHVQTDHRFTRREIEALLSENGFHPIYSTHWNSLLFPLIVATRLWRKIRPLPASDLEDASGEGMSGVLVSILHVERAIIRVMPIPIGLSILVVARKEAGV